MKNRGNRERVDLHSYFLMTCLKKNKEKVAFIISNLASAQANSAENEGGDGSFFIDWGRGMWTLLKRKICLRCQICVKKLPLTSKSLLKKD